MSSQPWFALPLVLDGRYVMLAWGSCCCAIFDVADLMADDVVLDRAALVIYVF